MQQLPNMSRRANSPRRKQDKKKTLPALASSGAAVLIIMFAMGSFPQINAFFHEVNEAAREHNDEIVRLIVHYAPALLVGVCGLGLTMMLIGSLRGRRRSA